MDIDVPSGLQKLVCPLQNRIPLGGFSKTGQDSNQQNYIELTDDRLFENICRPELRRSRRTEIPGAHSCHFDGGAIDVDAEHPKAVPSQKDCIISFIASDIEDGAASGHVLQNRLRGKIEDGRLEIDLCPVLLLAHRGVHLFSRPFVSVEGWA